ncbi:biopolymer transporter ExbD [Sphingomonas sp.]|uniref:ExbD/TolR family protein n=1 Tax=Sphingomonas sp. TaxID=28214 RepID=UPI001B0477E0|nr:biopolymer transporter ExbD [Sphingomonas sp.]MBO9714400.1 biopolymer transporter ExbD [Sphingomonas sp.]
MARAVRAVVTAEPMSAINVTPFIDVLLVLLIMLILTVPIATHKVSIDLPNGPSSVAEANLPHKLLIDRQGDFWFDARKVDEAGLRQALDAIQQGDQPPELHVQSDPDAPYARFDRALVIVKRANITRLGFVGNEHMVDF